MTQPATQILYLKGENATRILRDGPALRIQSRHQSDRIVAYRRLLRIPCFGQVQWHSDALLGCANYQVPVLFCRQNGQLRAALHGVQANQNHLDLSQALENCLQSVEGAETLKRWLVRQRQLAMEHSEQVLLQRFGLTMQADRPAQYRAIAQAYLNRQQWKKCQQLALAQLQASVCDQLLRQQIPVDQALLQRHHIKLLDELVKTLLIILLPQLLSHVCRLKKIRNRRKKQQPDLFLLVLQWHEKHKKRITREAENQVLRLNRLMLEIEHAEEYH